MEAKEKIKRLPSMAEIAVKAKKMACENPSAIDTDDEMLPWIFDEDSGVWFSFNGNYSKYSPEEKRWAKLKYERLHQTISEEGVEKAKRDIAWSIIRQKVLDRDNRTCQMCGNVPTTPLHVHHIMKVKEGGTDHLDNLITLCPRCHINADRKFYNPDWQSPPKNI